MAATGKAMAEELLGKLFAPTKALQFLEGWRFDRGTLLR
jgi:hypothetical protein